MASVFEHAVPELIKTSSIERVVAPIATHLCHLILLCENGDVTEHVDGLGRAAEDVEEATRRMAEVASRLSVESNDDVTKKEMEPVAESLKASGQHVLLAALKLRVHPHEAELREELIASTQNVLLGVLKVLDILTVASAILYAVACWGSRLRVADANRLNKLIQKTGDVVGVELDSLMAVSERRMLSKLRANVSHPLNDTLVRQELVQCKTHPTEMHYGAPQEVLLVEDDAAVRKIVKAAHRLMDCLSEIGAAPSVSLLLNAFQKFSDALLMLSKLAWTRAKDLRDAGQQESVFCSLETLNRSISVLYNATDSSIKHPQSTEAQAAKKYILDHVASTLRDLVSALKSSCSGKSLSQEGSYRMKLDGLLKLLDVPQHTQFTDSGFDSLLRDLIIHCMVVANSSHKNKKKVLVDNCQHVLQLWSEISQNTNSRNCPDHDQMQQNNGDKYGSLKKQLQKLDCSVVRAILYQLLDAFVVATVAFEDLMNAAGQPLFPHPNVLEILKPLFTTFVSHTDKLIQVAGFISSLSTNAKDVENVANSTTSLQRLKSNMTPLLLGIKENREFARPLKKLENLQRQWIEETSHFIDAVSYIVDVKEFIGVALEEMKNQRYNCNRALNMKSHIQFNKHAANLIACMKLVAQAVRRHINKNNNPIFRNGLLVLVKQVEASIDSVRACIRDISAKEGLDIKPFASFSEKTSVADEKFRILWQGLNGLQHPHLLSPLREEARGPTVSLLSLTTEGPDLNDVPVLEFTVAESDEKNPFIQSPLNGLDQYSDEHFMMSSDINNENQVKIPVNCDFHPAQTIEDLDLLPPLYKLLNAVKIKDLTAVNLTCSELVELSNFYAQAVNVAVGFTNDVESQELENLKSDIVALTHTLVKTAQEAAMSSVMSTDSIYKQVTLFSNRINQTRKILLPIAGNWYRAICATFQSQPQTDATQEITSVMCTCADIVELVMSSDIQQGKHQERITTQSKLQAAQLSAKLLTEMVTSIPPGSDHFEASSVLWALSIQVLLNSIDKVLGVTVEGGTSPFRCHRSSLQKYLSLVSENSIRIQEASRLSSLICKNPNTVKNMRDLQQEVGSFTEAYLQAAENLNTAPLANLQQLARTELLKRALQVKLKALSAHLTQVNKEYTDAFQRVIHLAVSAAAGNDSIEKREATQLEFDKCAESLIGDMEAVSQKVQDCLNYVRDPRVRAVLRFTNEHLLCQMSGIVSRARKMVDSQNTCDLPSLEMHVQCWSANAHFLVVELNKVEGIHPGMKQQVRCGLQGKQPWDMPAEISSAQKLMSFDTYGGVRLNGLCDEHLGIKDSKPSGSKTAEKKEGATQPVRRRAEPSFLYTSLSLKREMDKVNVQNNHVVQVTEAIAEKIYHMVQYLRKKGPIQGKEAFVSTAKDVISGCQRITRFVGFVTDHCLDQQCTDELLRIMERIATTTKQLTIISSVNAVTPGCRSSDEILVKNVQNLLHIIVQGIRAAEAACIKGLKQPEPNSEGTEAVALCFQWRQNLLMHRAQQNTSLETDDFGLRKICPHEAAPSLAPPIPMQEFYRWPQA